MELGLRLVCMARKDIGINANFLTGQIDGWQSAFLPGGRYFILPWRRTHFTVLKGLESVRKKER